MTLDKARELISMHSSLGSGDNRNASQMVAGKVMRDHGQQAVDGLIREIDLKTQWDIKPGAKFESAF